MGHLLATGLTYLPATAATVLVEYEVDDSDEAERAFRAWRDQLDPATMPGLVGETLYRARLDGENRTLRGFVNIGHWRSAADFDRRFGSSRDKIPGHELFEVGQRRRLWLTRDIEHR
jgi:hypothetical protein